MFFRIISHRKEKQTYSKWNTSTHKGSTALGHLSWIARPWEKSITSSSVPWITSTGDVTFETLSMLAGKIITKFKGNSTAGFNTLRGPLTFSQLQRDKITKSCSQYIPWKSVKTPGALCLGKSDTHTRH